MASSFHLAVILVIVGATIDQSLSAEEATEVITVTMAPDGNLTCYKCQSDEDTSECATGKGLTDTETCYAGESCWKTVTRTKSTYNVERSCKADSCSDDHLKGAETCKGDDDEECTTCCETENCNSAWRLTRGYAVMLPIIQLVFAVVWS